MFKNVSLPYHVHGGLEISERRREMEGGKRKMREGGRERENEALMSITKTLFMGTEVNT